MHSFVNSWVRPTTTTTTYLIVLFKGILRSICCYFILSFYLSSLFTWVCSYTITNSCFELINCVFLAFLCFSCIITEYWVKREVRRKSCRWTMRVDWAFKRAFHASGLTLWIISRSETLEWQSWVILRYWLRASLAILEALERPNLTNFYTCLFHPYITSLLPSKHNFLQ